MAALFMSPQARRRLHRTMAEVELRDLRDEIAEALEATGLVLGEEERAVVLAALLHGREEN